MTDNKKIYKIVVESTFHEAKRKRDGTLLRMQTITKQHANDEITVDTLADALDALSKVVHLSIKEYGNRNCFELRYSLMFVSSKCKVCGSWMESPRMIANGYYDGEYFMSAISSISKHYGSFQWMIDKLLSNEK